MACWLMHSLVGRASWDGCIQLCAFVHSHNQHHSSNRRLSKQGAQQVCREAVRMQPSQPTNNHTNHPPLLSRHAAQGSAAQHSTADTAPSQSVSRPDPHTQATQQPHSHQLGRQAGRPVKSAHRRTFDRLTNCRPAGGAAVYLPPSLPPFPSLWTPHFSSPPPTTARETDHPPSAS